MLKLIGKKKKCIFTLNNFVYLKPMMETLLTLLLCVLCLASLFLFVPYVGLLPVIMASFVHLHLFYTV